LTLPQLHMANVAASQRGKTHGMHIAVMLGGYLCAAPVTIDTTNCEGASDG